MGVLYKLEPYDIRKLKAKDKKKSSIGAPRRKLYLIVEEFIASGHDCCRICICDTFEDAHVQASNLRRSVRTYHYDNIEVVRRGVEIYFVQKNKWEER